MSKLQIPRAVARKLGHYVYLYIDPRNKSIFYVGKGRGGRAIAHLKASEEAAIGKRIREIESAGRKPQIELLAHGLENERTALRVEAAAIDLIGVPNLVNAVRGHGAKHGRLPLEEVQAFYERRIARIREPAILIRINQRYHYGMTPVELYDATRSAWRVGPKREKAELALAIFEGVVREVYRISRWLPGGSTFATQRSGEREEIENRWEFVGTLAEEPIRNRYRNKFVGEVFKQGAQNPITYVNID